MDDLKSNWNHDYQEEQRLGEYLDTLYEKIYSDKFEIKRITDEASQKKGIDLTFTSKQGTLSKIDEKAQLAYINKTLPTFAFELLSGTNAEGWLFDENKETDIYFLINGIQVNNKNDFTKCIIYSVKRDILIDFLNKRGLSRNKVNEYTTCIYNSNCNFKKLTIDELNDYNEGYITYSTHLKERPINLVLKLQFLLDNKIAKLIYAIK